MQLGCEESGRRKGQRKARRDISRIRGAVSIKPYTDAGEQIEFLFKALGMKVEGRKGRRMFPICRQEQVKRTV